MLMGVDTCPSKQLTKKKKKVIENLKEQNKHSAKKKKSIKEKR